jgi:hypothetical protein
MDEGFCFRLSARKALTLRSSQRLSYFKPPMLHAEESRQFALKRLGEYSRFFQPIAVKLVLRSGE